MKINISGKRYDSARCEVIAERTHYNNGNYAGTASLLRAKDGTYLLLAEGNGQDFYFADYFSECENPIEELDTMEMTDEQEARAVELGLIKLV